MRPVWMKIKGLNSFLEAQEVDFELLGNQGLFGILDPQEVERAVFWMV